MNAIQKNRLSRNQRVINCLEREEISALLASVPEYVELKAALDQHTSRIEMLQTQQFSFRRIVYARQLQMRDKTIPVCLTLATALFALGTRTEDTMLLEAATVNDSGLKALPFFLLASKALNLTSLATTFKTELQVYFLTEDAIESARLTAENFAAAVEAANAAMDEQKQMTAGIIVLLKETDGIVKRIALVVNTLKVLQPRCCELFEIACRVVHAARTTLSASGYVLDDTTGDSIAKCRMKITSVKLLGEPTRYGEKPGIAAKKLPTTTAELTKTIKLSSVNGAFRYKNLPDGTYEVTAFRSGYANQTVLFHVNAGDCAEVIIRLQKSEQAAA